MTYPESLLSARREMDRLGDRLRGLSQAWSGYGMGAHEAIRLDLERACVSREHAAAASRYERELSAYEASRSGTMVSDVTGLTAYNVESPEGRAALAAVLEKDASRNGEAP